VRLEIQLDTAGRGSGGNAAAARLDYAAGGSLALTSLGSGRFSGAVPAAQLFHDYKPDDVNRNFVGFIRLLDSANAVLASYNAFISVMDANIPPVSITTRDNAARHTTRILNVHRSAIKTSDLRTAVQQFYAYFPDDFDFVQVVFTVPSYQANRVHLPVRNDVSGIGLSLFNNTSEYGSAGRLLGLNVFPIDSLFDLAGVGFSHETGHQWINYVKHPMLTPGPHWPPSTMASGVMGFNIPGGGVGGDFNYAIEQAGDGMFRVKSQSAPKEFSDVDLYLMGLLPASHVSPGIVLEGTACHDCILPGAPIRVDDIIAMHGPRLPDSTKSPKSFRIGTLVISRDRLLNDDEMALLEHFAARGEARDALPYTNGFQKAITKPFYLATRGLATVDFRLTTTPRRRAVAR
jgi:hypothetical protein